MEGKVSQQMTFSFDLAHKLLVHGRIFPFYKEQGLHLMAAKNRKKPLGIRLGGQSIKNKEYRRRVRTSKETGRSNALLIAFNRLFDGVFRSLVGSSRFSHEPRDVPGIEVFYHSLDDIHSAPKEKTKDKDQSHF